MNARHLALNPLDRERINYSVNDRKVGRFVRAARIPSQRTEGDQHTLGQTMYGCRGELAWGLQSNFQLTMGSTEKDSLLVMMFIRPICRPFMSCA